MSGITLGLHGGGPTPLFQASELIARVLAGMESSRGDSDDWSVNVIFLVPGQLSRPDFAGIRTGMFDRQAEQLVVLVAVPDKPFAGWEEMAGFVLDSLEAATSKAEEYFRLEGLDVDLGEAWGQISALGHEFALRPAWAVDLPGEAVDDTAPEARAILDAFEAKRAAAAPIRAELRLLSSDDGGRHFPITYGHHTECAFGTGEGEGERVLDHVVLYVEGGDGVDPGQIGMVRMHPVSAERWAGVNVGTLIEVREGSRIVGEATVTELLGT